MENAPQPLRVILVEDSDDDAFLLTNQLRTAGYDVYAERVDNSPDLQKALEDRSWDIVFSDFSMPCFDGMQALKVVRDHDPDLPFIIVSGTVGEERAVQLMKLGAQDYVIKGNVQRLIPAIARELREATLRRDHRIAQDRIRELAYSDPLTQLPNRHRLTEDVDMANTAGNPVILLLVNLNNFRDINGALGLNMGDELLKAAASRLQSCIGADAKLYHLHGNEFSLLLQVNDPIRAEQISQEIAQAFSLHFSLDEFRVHIGIRVGIAKSQRAEAANVLLQHADLAATSAKREGMPFAWYNAERDPSNPDRLALLADLHDALFTDQLRLAFQPKVNCETGDVTGCEALLQWQHPQRGLVPPDLFIGAAERAGLINDITRHVIQCAVNQIGTWNQSGFSLPIAINLSVINLQHGGLIDEILTIAKRGPVPSIEIEITETALMENPAQALAVLKKIYEAGVRIYIDDFGTGFSSLSYLKKLPIHGIKIDKSFVLDLERDAGSEAIVLSTINLAHNLGLTVIAEGVETDKAWKRLADFQCDEMQGFYFSKATDAPRLETIARRPTWRVK